MLANSVVPASVSPYACLSSLANECDSGPVPTWGDVIRAACHKTGWDQQELARHAGVHPQTVSNIVQGNNEPSRATVEKIASAAGWTVQEVYDLLNGATPPTDTTPEDRQMQHWEREVAAMFTLVSEQDRADIVADLKRRVVRRMMDAVPEKGAAGV